MALVGSLGTGSHEPHQVHPRTLGQARVGWHAPVGRCLSADRPCSSVALGALPVRLDAGIAGRAEAGVSRALGFLGDAERFADIDRAALTDALLALRVCPRCRCKIRLVGPSLARVFGCAECKETWHLPRKPRRRS